MTLRDDKMKIVVDCRPFVRSLAGTAMFLKLVIEAIQKYYPEVELVLITPKKFLEGINLQVGNKTRILIKPLSAFGRKLPNFLWFLFVVPYLLYKIKPDFYLSPSPAIPLVKPARVKNIIIVHDVVNIEWAGTMDWKNRMQNILLFNRSVRKADYIWTNSKYTKEKVKCYFPKRKSIGIFSGLSVNENLYRRINVSENERDSLLAHYGISKKYILFVGTIEPRKNLQFLLKIFPAIAQKKNVQLVVVGAKGWKDSSIGALVESNSSLRKNVVFTGFVPDKDLVSLYNLAECFVSTSLNEGFGMPQLEAMLCGCPVITAKNSAMIEVVEGRGICIGGWKEDKWINAIQYQLGSDRNNFYKGAISFDDYHWKNIITNFMNYLNRGNS